MSVQAAELLQTLVRLAGIDAVYGQPCSSLNVTLVPDDVADTFALAHQRVHGARAAVHVGGGTFRFPGSPAVPPLVTEIQSPTDLPGALTDLRSGGDVELRLLFPLSQPVDDDVQWPTEADDGWIEPADEVVEAIQRARRVSVLAGPEVVRAGAVPGLHELAAKANLGVLNTWGAKGVFHWRSRHHLATVGLQEDDFSLSGLGDVDVILATGLDAREAPDHRWRLAPAWAVAPGALAALAEHSRPLPGEIGIPLLRTRLAGVTQRGWATERGPLPPTRVTMHYAECLGFGALIAADAGIAGYWVARTLGTTRLGGVVVPSSPIPGFAAACVAVSQLRRPDRPALAVVDGFDGEQTAAVVDAARSLGLAVPMEVWDPEGPRLDADEHRYRLLDMITVASTSSSVPQSLGTDQHQMAEMVDVAGPIVAWT